MRYVFVAQRVAFCLFLVASPGCAFKKPASPSEDGVVAQKESKLGPRPEGKLSVAWLEPSGGVRTVERNFFSVEAGLVAEYPVTFTVAPEHLDLKTASPVLLAQAEREKATRCVAKAWNRSAQPFRLSCVLKGEGVTDLTLQGVGSILPSGLDEAFKVEVAFVDDSYEPVAKSIFLHLRTLPNRLPSEPQAVQTRSSRLTPYASGTINHGSIGRLASPAVTDPGYTLLQVLELGTIKGAPTEFEIPTTAPGTFTRNFAAYTYDSVRPCKELRETRQTSVESANLTVFLLPIKDDLSETWPEILARGFSVTRIEAGERLRLGLYARNPYLSSVMSAPEAQWREQTHREPVTARCAWTGRVVGRPGDGDTQSPYVDVVGEGNIGREELEPALQLMLSSIKVRFADDATYDREPYVQVLEPISLNQGLRQ